MPSAAFYPWHRRRAEAILERARVIVARDRDRPHFIFGYGIFERIGSDFIGHWLYVRQDERRAGIARLILAGALAQPDLAEGTTRLLASCPRTYAAETAQRLGFEFVKLPELAPYAHVDKQGGRACA